MKKVKSFTLFLAIALLHTLGAYAQVDSSDNINLTEDPFVTMIKLGSMNIDNPLYNMPLLSGSANGYIQSATTSGDGVVIPLAYARNSTPSTYFVIESRNPNIVQQGRSFDLKLMMVNMTGKSVSVFADWNRDGAFETAVTTVSSLGSDLNLTIPVPADAVLGKTRLRLSFSTAAVANAEATVTSGRIYDFVLYVANNQPLTDYFVSVSTNPTDGGVAYINTPAKENGRYDLGTQVEVEAVANETYVFKGWVVQGDTVSRNAKYTFEVTASTALTAAFYAPLPEREAPIVSTAASPVWYQIMNAHTNTNRAERCLTYSATIPSGYSTQLRCVKPATTEDVFLWRLDDAGNGMVRLVHKESNMEIGVATNISSTIYMMNSGAGAPYQVYESGHENGSYTIAHNGATGRYLNAADGSWEVVLYNAGVGTGSGWYFYRVGNITTGVTGMSQEDKPMVYAENGNIIVSWSGKTVKANLYTMTGQRCESTTWNNDNVSLTPSQQQTIYTIEVLTKCGERFITKIYY